SVTVLSERIAYGVRKILRIGTLDADLLSRAHQPVYMVLETKYTSIICAHCFEDGVPVEVSVIEWRYSSFRNGQQLSIDVYEAPVPCFHLHPPHTGMFAVIKFGYCQLGPVSMLWLCLGFQHTPILDQSQPLYPHQRGSRLSHLSQ